MAKMLVATPEPNMVAFLKTLFKIKNTPTLLRLRHKNIRTVAKPIDESGNAI